MQERSGMMAARNGMAVPVALSLVGWGLILWAIDNMASPTVALMMPMRPAWTTGEAVAVCLMWTVMMAAMMLPSAIPMLAVHRRVLAERAPLAQSSGALFLAGYLFAWTLFSLAASVLQWGFQQAGILSPMVKLQSGMVGGCILLLAGAFQLAPLKTASLTHCRTPDATLRANWRTGRSGALRMGLHEGLCCIGCCWALMLVLFVGGVMSLTAIAVLTLAVAVEKLAPQGVLLARLGGILLIGWGLWLIAEVMAAAPDLP